jgi:catalase
MPLPNDERVVALANELLSAFDKIFEYHPTFRAAHAKGVLLTGKFTPSKEAATITKAEHMNREVPVFMRFSNSTGLPTIPDNSADASPRGAAVRFMLGEHKHTDIVSHSVDAFPTHDGAEFLEFLHALMAGGPAVEQFLAAHPPARAFVQMPKPFPTSFARESFFAVSAFEFLNADGKSVFGRYRILPVDGNEFLNEQDANAKDANYLMDEIAERVQQRPVRFRVLLQLAEAGDVVDDATTRWPETRRLVELGVIELTGVAPDNAEQQQRIIFDPIPRIDGINATADPLFELRAAIYLLSGRRRRAAVPVASTSSSV